MGMDAKAKIWLGIRTDQYIDLDENPEGKENADNLLKELGNYEIETIDICDNLVGYGIVLVRHDWDDLAREIALTKIKEIEAKKPQIQQALNLIGVEGEVKLWLSADYS